MERSTSAIVLLLAGIVATQANARFPNFRNASSDPSLIIGGFLPPPVPPPPSGQVQTTYTAWSKKVPDEFGEGSSVTEVGLSNNFPWVEGRRMVYSNIQEYFCTTLYYSDAVCMMYAEWF